MELCSSNIEKIPIFIEKILIFPEMKPCTFWSQPSKLYQKTFLYFFLKTQFEKICYISSKEISPYISRNGILHFPF